MASLAASDDDDNSAVTSAPPQQQQQQPQQQQQKKKKRMTAHDDDDDDFDYLIGLAEEDAVLQEASQQAAVLRLERERQTEAKQAPSAAVQAAQSRTQSMHDKNKSCQECGILSFNVAFFKAFKQPVCNRCMRDQPQRYDLIAKTTAKEQFMVSKTQLEEHGLVYMERKNPKHATWGRMHLYLKHEVVALALKQHGTLEALEKAKNLRDIAKMERRISRKAKKERKKSKRYAPYVMKTPVACYDEHDFEDAVVPGDAADGSDDKQVERCKTCGFEIEFD
jgi:DNA repair protein